MRNAAKVAFGTFVVGCGGSIVVGQEPDAGNDASKPKNDASAVDAALVDSVVPEQDAALACLGETGVDASDVTEEQFQCCVASLQNDVGDASLWTDNGADAGLVANDPPALNCCRAVLARVDDEPDGGDFGGDYQALTASGGLLEWCCMAAGTPMGPACTPWGPPAPPAMPTTMMEVA